MKVYLVIRQGVYRHEIMGIYVTYAAAVKRAQACAHADRDGYHSYDVYPANLSQDMEDLEDCVYTARKA